MYLTLSLEYFVQVAYVIQSRMDNNIASARHTIAFALWGQVFQEYKCGVSGFTQTNIIVVTSTNLGLLALGA